MIYYINILKNSKYRNVETVGLIEISDKTKRDLGFD